MAIQRIKVNLIPTGATPVCYASQYDVGRKIALDVFNGIQPYIFTDEQLELDVRKSDGTFVTLDVPVTIKSNTVEFITTQQMCACAGANTCELRVYKDGSDVGTANFSMQIERSPSEGGLKSESEINNLTTQMQRILDPMLEDEVPPIVEQVVGENYPTRQEVNQALGQLAEAVNGKADASDIPTKTSQLQNDSGFAEIDDTSTANNKAWSAEKVNTELSDKASASELNSVESLLNFTKGDSTTFSDSFVGYQRKTVFANVELKANTTYYFRIAFDRESDIQGYYAVSKTDNTTPDYAWTNLLGKKTADFTYTPSSDLTVNITARFNNSGTYAFECSYSESKSTIYTLEDDLIDLQSKFKLANSLNQPFKYKKRYDHLFSTRTGVNCTIPMQSLFHVRLSKKFGFDVIEGNVNKTSDGKYFVHHMAADDKFGGFFHHVDGVTDISNIVCTTVTWDWIEQNVRYNSNITKYQTRPCTLEEFLGECRQQELMPMLEIIDLNVVAIADKILGKGNYIAYGGSRSLTPNAIMYQWKNLATKQEILDYCDQFGTPMIYGMALPSRFTDEELQDIINSLHEKGYQIGVSYVYEKASDYFYKGVDVDGAQNYINRIESGNLCNFSATFGFDDFNFTNATETDGVLTYSSNGTFAPDIANTVYQFCAIDIELVFDGTINVPAIGEASAVTITSDGTKPSYFAIPIINGSPLLTISVNSGTKIIDAKFKASAV